MWRSEQGTALVAALVTIFLLMGVAAIGTFGGYTNLLTSTNLRLATRARAQAEANINEALYRLSSPSGLQEQIVPNLSDPDWQSEIIFNASPGTEQVASIQETDHWPAEAYRSASITTLQYKKNEDGDLIFYNRTLPVTDPPFLAVTLPDLLGLGVVDPLARLLDQTFQALCSVNVGGVGVGEVVEVGNINVGGTLGLCPSPTTPDIGYPVIQIRATGVDDRNAEREFLAEAVRTVQFTPVAPLAAGGNVNLNNNGFIDGVNHHPGIVLTAGNGAGATYGDDDSETTEGYSGLVTLVKDSPDDNGLWFSLFGFLAGVTKYGIANVSPHGSLKLRTTSKNC